MPRIAGASTLWFGTHSDLQLRATAFEAAVAIPDDGTDEALEAQAYRWHNAASNHYFVAHTTADAHAQLDRQGSRRQAPQGRAGTTARLQRESMNSRSIAEAHDPDLRSSVAAIERAARQARELARQTGTKIVISRNGVIEHLDPDAPELETITVQEPSVGYGNQT